MLLLRQASPLLRARTPLIHRPAFRFVSTLPENDHIYVHPTETPQIHRLSLLPTPEPELSLGTTTVLPPTPRAFKENPLFLPLIRPILSQSAAKDPIVQSDALAFASTGGSSFHAPKPRASSGGAGGANVQGGAGGAGVGGWLHVYDMRGVPAFGRIPETEDILGSILVDGSGKLVDGSWEDNVMYRPVTAQGTIRLSDYLHQKVVDGLNKKKKSGGL
ncbi:hypothetical protein EX30DRAFT_356839 [Ascodesmis nigricans]|uniref:Uncharacterized protein n=1 Tax=Ascodesmis nigricans TaxID=341454 RepID=A0A4S2N630_9PEZI|nr:hypothetical protein EX30DRAFT_356839 [Ascodesmis nigricans]